MANVLIAGAGYVGTALGERLAGRGHLVYGARRDAARLPSVIQGLSLDLLDRRALERVPRSIEYVFYTAAPDTTGDEAYRATYVSGLSNVLDVAAECGWPLRHVFFSSSTAVYGQDDGGWVNEASPTEPRHFTGARMLEAETRLFASGVPATSVRFGGIYGPGRTGLLERVQSGVASYVPAAPAYTNRIHRDDCAGVLLHLLEMRAPERLYLAVDDEPVDNQTLLTWLADALQAPAPAPSPSSSGATGRRGTNKRCSNARLRSSGYVFTYPTFREGYAELVKDRLTAT